MNYQIKLKGGRIADTNMPCLLLVGRSGAIGCAIVRIDIIADKRTIYKHDRRLF